MNGSRVVRVGMTFDLLFDIMKEGYKMENGIECIEGLPADVEYVDSYVDNPTRILYFVFRHPTFREVELGEMIPEKRIVHRISPPPKFIDRDAYTR